MPRMSLRALTLTLVMAASPGTLHAQPGDAVEVASGDRITGSVSRLERGRLAFRTASAGPGHQRFAGTISIVWAEVVSLTCSQHLDVELASGERFAGSISSPSPGRLVVQTASGPTRPIPVAEFVWIAPIEAGFRGRTVGSVDLGVSYSSAEGARTYTLRTEASYRSPGHAYEAQFAFYSWLSARDETETLTRNDFLFDVRRTLQGRWFAVAKFETQQDGPLQLDVRILAGGGVGRVLVQSNRTRLYLQGGLDYDAERYESAQSFDHSAEVFAGVDWDWFESGGAVEAAVAATTFIGLERPRARLELDATIRRDVFWRMYWALSVHEGFDSDPPADRPRSNLGMALSLGWSF